MNNCEKCGLSLDIGVSLINIPEHCKEHFLFKYMRLGEGMHFDCYIETLIDSYKPKQIET